MYFFRQRIVLHSVRYVFEMLGLPLTLRLFRLDFLQLYEFRSSLSDLPGNGWIAVSPILSDARAISDLVIGMSYLAISLTLVLVIYRGRRYMPFNWVILTFGLAIVAVGATNFTEAVTAGLWGYTPPDSIRLMTAFAALATALLLLPLVPRVFELLRDAKQSREHRLELEEANQQLQQSIAEHEQTEQALRASTSTLRSLFLASPLAIYTLDENGNVVLWNPAAEQIFGWKAEELSGKPLPTIPSEAKAQFAALRERAGRGEAFHSFQTRRRTKAGDSIEVSIANAPLRDVRGNVVGLLGMAADITEQNRLKRDFQSQEELLREVVDANPNAISVKNTDGQYILVNRALADLFGKQKSEIVGHYAEDLFDQAEDAARSRAQDQEVLGTRQRLFVAQDPISDPDTGAIRWFQTAKIPLFGADGEPHQILGVATDVTDYNLAKRRLVVQHDVARVLADSDSVLDAMPSVLRAVCENLDWALGELWAVNEDGQVLTCVETWHEPDTDRTDWKQTSAQMRFALGEGLPGRVWESGEPLWVEDITRDSDPQLKQVAEAAGLHAAFSLPIRLGGEVLGVMVFFHSRKLAVDHDLLAVMGTVGRQVGQFIERQRGAEKLRRSEEWLRAIFDASRDGLLVEDEGTIVYVNRAYADLLQYQPEELIGQQLAMILPPAETGRLMQFGRERLAGGHPPSSYEFSGKRRDGTLVDVEGVVSTSVIGGKKFITTAIRDVTERRQTEAALRESEQLYRFLAEGILHQVWTALPNGRLDFVNERTAQYFGAAAANLTGDGWQDYLHPDDLPDCLDRWRRSLVSGNTYEVEFRLRRHDGEYRWHLGLATAGRDEKGGVVRWFGTNTDIHEQKVTESALRVSEEQLQQAQKMESIGTLAGGVAHDFNNLLTVILGNTQLVIRNVDPDSTSARRLGEVERASQRASELTRQLLAFSRRQQLERKVVNVNHTIGELIRMLQRLIGEDIEVRIKAASDLALVYVDPVQLEQVVMNLAVNARDAMSDGGVLTIETRNAVLDDSTVPAHYQGEPGRYVEVIVSDTGTGMDSETISRIFEPFYTTKEVGKGTGLGLSMVYGIMKQHDGFVNVHSELGRGTAFHLYFKAEDYGSPDRTSEVSRAWTGGTETILVAEDEAALRALARDVLEGLGYKVLLASNGEEAIELFKARQDEVKLVILDVVMPRMGGLDAAEQIRAIRAGTRIIFMTGYSEETIERRAQKTTRPIEEMGAIVIRKPYEVANLGQQVRTVLDQNDA